MPLWVDGDQSACPGGAEQDMCVQCCGFLQPTHLYKVSMPSCLGFFCFTDVFPPLVFRQSRIRFLVVFLWGYLQKVFQEEDQSSKSAEKNVPLA